MSLLERRRNIMCSGKGKDEYGLFAYWDEADGPTGSPTTIWTDRINGLKLTLSSNSIRSNGQYKIPYKERIILKDPIDEYINFELMYEIGYDVKTNSTDYGYKVVDFGGIGNGVWNYSFSLTHSITSGKVLINPKNSANKVQTMESEGNAGTYSTGDWLYNKVARGGIRLLDNGKQQVWGKIDDSDESKSVGLTAYELHPLPLYGINGLGTYGYFSLGSSGSAVVFDENLIVHYVKLYSKSI